MNWNRNTLNVRLSSNSDWVRCISERRRRKQNQLEFLLFFWPKQLLRLLQILRSLHTVHIANTHWAKINIKSLIFYNIASEASCFYFQGKSVCSIKRALDKACARSSVRSIKACAQKSVRSKKRALFFAKRK